ncbi:cytochrome-c peroxidase [Dyadobacter pollutisoli]|uniref:Cytochrome C peroxidase n=1 Tax=Dyadobacter pollutisoli TaxID=2910158 RepID=A0A9E8N649_9BACT|nr:cytochrome c peroxidase [Dyadobacter pollutisoli]WAC10028.1 cytochrome C peroxidase [Dyadobacter pollutisoli]
MRKFLRTVPAFICVLILSYCQPKKSPKDQLYSQFNEDLDSLILMNDELLELAKSRQKPEVLRDKFLSVRLQYKKTEAFAEYFFPTTVRLVNGAPLDEIEDEENAVFEPGGYQVIEELVYIDEPIEEEELIRHTRKTQVNVKRIQSLWKDIQLTDSQVMDALRLEMFRLTTLGISGFDTPASGNSIAESKVVVESFQRYADAYKELLPEYQKLTNLSNAAIDFLKNSKSFNDFNRASFIVDYINPLCLSLHQNQKLAGIAFVKDHRLLRGDAATLFDKKAFDPEALLSNTKFSSTADRIALGEKLFYDPRVSGNGQTSCGSCHQPQLAFTDGLKTSKGFGNENLKRNAPTIMYAALQQALFYDLRSPSLEDQAADVIHNKNEMHGSVEDIAKLISSDNDYKNLFSKAYPELDSTQPVYIQNSLAVFVRSLNPFNSPFDKYMRGDKKALTDGQVNGFNLFMGKAKCGTCHFMPLFNGTVPPDYQRTESEVLGVTASADLKHPLPDQDLGRGVHNQFPQWKNAFKTSTVRNIAKTAPYMHNGAFNTLQEVMEFYNEGGGAGLGLEVHNQTFAADKLNLTPKEIALVIEFMEGLTD